MANFCPAAVAGGITWLCAGDKYTTVEAGNPA